MKIQVKKVGEHRGFCREYFKNISNGNIYARQEEFKNVYKWYTTTSQGEPDCHLREDIEIEIVGDWKENKAEDEPIKFNYMMLDRLRSDCEYYLGYGYRNTNGLYYKDEQRHIDKMKERYNNCPTKPEWLTWEQILEYEKAMVI